MGENHTFHPQTALLASGASKTPKKQQEKSLFSRGAPPGGHLGHFWHFSRKGVEMGEFTPKWAILPKFGVLGHFRDFRDSGLPEMQAPGGPASPIWEPPDFPR